jgi:hypothetical protein
LISVGSCGFGPEPGVQARKQSNSILCIDVLQVLHQIAALSYYFGTSRRLRADRDADSPSGIQPVHSDGRKTI